MINNPLLIYAVQKTSRVEYIFSTLFEAMGISNLKLTTDVEQFKFHIGAKINYSNNRITAEEYWVMPVELLFEKQIKPQPTNCFIWNDVKAFYKTEGSHFPFDIFAASFYLLSRYEEYLPHAKDMYGRYAHENSIAFKEDFLPLPLVNIWLKEFAKKLLQKFPSLAVHPPTFHFLPTYDIDMAWSYLHKGFLRNGGGLVTSILKGEWKKSKERLSVLISRKNDPFDSYQWLHQLHESHRLKPLYFFLLAQTNKHYDKNILPSSISLKELIQQHNEKYSVGIHPSWQSGDKAVLLKTEIENLRHITGKKITKSRQHYIRMQLPDTYKHLIDAGIIEDYSMGYGSINGFRASFCLPFAWYDLQKEETTPLLVYPFCYMDANSFYEQHYTAQQALEELNHYYTVVKEVDGLLITIWHNHFLGRDKMFDGWKEVYEKWVGGERK